MTDTLIQALLSPTSYPHPVSNLRLLETHISWVLLTGEFAYKIKKPVNFGFLDFSTLSKRRHWCEEELRLNSRFSTGLYLAVVAITGSEDAPRVAGTGDILDYAVKMRQFDQDDLLEALAGNGALGMDDIKALAKKLAEFHLSQAARLADNTSDFGTVATIAGAVEENFRQIAPSITSAEARSVLEDLQAWSMRQLAELQDVFAMRRTQGFVRECHGDLHLRNIARLDGEITFFDCIEFNPQFSWIDVQSELAFLLMDMEQKQPRSLSNRLLNVYLEYTGDYQGLEVLQFYKVYRALVRAKVTVLKVKGGNLSSAEEDEVWQEYAAYIELAQSYCQPKLPFLGLMYGISGTGKSTVAATLASESAAITIRSDVERKRLFGLAPEAKSDGEQKLQMYGDTASAQTFAALERLATNLLRLGYPVLVDATFIAEQWRRPFLQLAQKLEIPFVIIECTASEQVILQRLAKRQLTQRDASEAGADVMRSQRRSVEPFTSGELSRVLTIDTERPIDPELLKKYFAKHKNSGA